MLDNLATADPRAPKQQASPSIPRLQLAFDSAFWQFTFVAIFIELYALVSFVLKVAPMAPWARKMRFFLYRFPSMIVQGMIIALVACLAIDLLLRFVVSPLVHRWRRPKTIDHSIASFHLELGESIHRSTPARMRLAPRVWRPGLLAVSNRRLKFIPNAWDEEPWSAPLAPASKIDRVAAPPLLSGLVKGVPDRARISDPGGLETLFMIADHFEFLDHVQPADALRSLINR